MRAKIFGQVPLFNAASLITGDEFSLIRMDADIIDLVNVN
jgi:hypothetical protein